MWWRFTMTSEVRIKATCVQRLQWRHKALERWPVRECSPPSTLPPRPLSEVSVELERSTSGCGPPGCCISPNTWPAWTHNDAEACDVGLCHDIIVILCSGMCVAISHCAPVGIAILLRAGVWHDITLCTGVCHDITLRSGMRDTLSHCAPACVISDILHIAPDSTTRIRKNVMLPRRICEKI